MSFQYSLANVSIGIFKCLLKFLIIGKVSFLFIESTSDTLLLSPISDVKSFGFRPSSSILTLIAWIGFNDPIE